jgi:chromosome segregation ATPase
MKDDVQTLLEIIATSYPTVNSLTRSKARDALDRLQARIAELEKENALNIKSRFDLMGIIEKAQVEVNSLRKALDDRHADDLKAWKAIMRATGEERGIPPNKEVVAYHVAEVERLEKESSGWKQLYETEKESAEAVDLDNISLRAKLDDAIAELRSKDPNFTPIFDSYSASCQRLDDEAEALRANLDRAKEALQRISKFDDDGNYRHRPHMGMNTALEAYNRVGDTARAILSELSADAPAQQTQISDEVRDAMGEAEKALEAITTRLEPHDVEDGPVWVNSCWHIAREALLKLRSVMK